MTTTQIGSPEAIAEADEMFLKTVAQYNAKRAHDKAVGNAPRPKRKWWLQGAAGRRPIADMARQAAWVQKYAA